MKNKALLLLPAIAVVLLTACTPAATPTPSPDATVDPNQGVVSTTNPIATNKPAPTKQISIEGSAICLPHKGAKPGEPQTMECAYGIQTKDKINYGVELSEMIDQFQVGKKYKIEGTVEENPTSNYDIKGTIEVSKITELK